MWTNSARIEEVGADVPVTNMLTSKPAQTAPKNLNFRDRKSTRLNSSH